jgi:two-component system sensor histidine kinase HydH
MRLFRPWILILAAVLLPAVLSVWAFAEVRGQQREVEEALRAEAALLAHTLGPALASASASSRELDELLSWKLLDNARLLARLESTGLDEEEMAELREANGLDAVLWLDAEGAVLRHDGAALDGTGLRERLAPLWRGEAEELLLAPGSGAEGPLMAAAVATEEGGAVVTLVDPTRAYAFTRQIGVANLLRTLVDTRAVLYLVYEETPGGERVEASWDGGPVPAGIPDGIPAGVPDEAVLRGQPVFEVAMPVTAPAGRQAALRVGLHGEPLQRATAAALRRIALVAVVSAAFGLASAGFTVVQRARAREREQARRRLADLEESHRRGERLAAAGALAAGLAHEVRNPLNGIGMAAQRIERFAGAEGERGGKTRELAALIRQEVARLEETLKGFLDLARPAAGPQVPLDLAALSRDSLGLLELEAAARGIRIELRGETAPALGDAEALRGAVENLLRNAIQASPDGGRIEVAVAVGRGSKRSRTVRVTVRDQGAGIDPALLERVFDPFVTTRARGTGLGLAMVRRVAGEHGGRSWLRNHPDGGVEAGIEIPALRQDRQRTVA